MKDANWEGVNSLVRLIIVLAILVLIGWIGVKIDLWWFKQKMEYYNNGK